MSSRHSYLIYGFSLLAVGQIKLSGDVFMSCPPTIVCISAVEAQLPHIFFPSLGEHSV